jgi:type II secretory pathway pseudopilin PulG
MFYSKKTQNGFTLVDVLVGVAVFMIIAVGVYQAFSVLMNAQNVSRLKITTTALANEQFEIARNLAYADVGVIGSIPNGKIPHMQILNRNGIDFTVETTIRNIDDQFDGTIGGSTNDLSPADYKLVQLKISCSTCHNFQPLDFTTYVGPKNLETASTNGALFIQVIDAAGQPVPAADVHIENNNAFPPIIIEDTTNNDGFLQIVDAPPGVGVYEITVTKNDYSTDKTYTVGNPENPNPIKPHATVALQRLTQISLVIDHASTIDVQSINQTCGTVPSIDFTLSGSKLIGISPDVLKYSTSYITDGSGKKTISNLEWDTYNLNLTDSSYDLAGTIPLVPLTLNPGANQDLKLIVVPKDPRSLLVTVKDASTQLPLSGATVQLEKTDYDTTFITGRGFVRQTDWSGGAGQANFIDSTKYFDSDGNVEVNDPVGEIRLRKTFDEYEPSGYLVSSTFDAGSASNFHQILWQPQDQSPDTGPDSMKFQIATNNDNATWNFVGPDGTASTFYTVSNQNINSTHNGDRYFRYKAYLQTTNTTYSPIISDVSFTFTSSCIPPGQVIFSGLDSGNYALTVSKSGYQTFTDTINISSPWQQHEVVLSP